MKKLISDLSDRALRWAFPGYYANAPLASKPEIDVDEEVPRYPPYEKGLPVYSTERLMRRQPEMLIKIRQTFSFPDEDYNRIILPVIERFASYIHLLPSSEHHHHKGAGGAFRHGLEVAFSAGRSSGAHIFMPEGTPLERKGVEIRWQAAIFFAGLLHDVGKPVTDVEVVNADGSLMWSPYSETISEWANKHGIERYFLRWKRNRGNEHRILGGSIAQSLIPKHVVHWLNEGGSDINQTLNLYLSGSEKLKHLLVDLVTKADSASVERDLVATGHGKIRDPGFGVPVEQFVLDAMRRLLADGTWKINEPGARVWVVSDGVTDGVFVVWKKAVEDIIELLQTDRIQGIPRNPDTLADVMIERDLAVSKKLGNQVYRYWPVCPDVLTNNGSPVRLLMLRLQAPSLLFAEPPPYVGAQIDPAPAPSQPAGTAGLPPSMPATAAQAPVPRSPAQVSPAAPKAPSASGVHCATCGVVQPHPVPVGTAWTCADCGGVHNAPPASTAQAAVPAASVIQPAQGPVASNITVSKPNVQAQGGKVNVPSVTVKKPEGGVLPKSAPKVTTGKAPLQPGIRRSPQDDGFWHTTEHEEASLRPRAGTAEAVNDAEPPSPPATPPATNAKTAAVASAARSELLGMGQAGRLLVAMAEDIAGGRSNWGECLVQLDEHLMAKMPEGFVPYRRFARTDGEPDAQPIELATLLRDAGWIVKEHRDAVTSMRVIAGIRGVVIRRDIAALVEAVAGDGSRPDPQQQAELEVGPSRQSTKPEQSTPRPTQTTGRSSNRELAGTAGVAIQQGTVALAEAVAGDGRRPVIKQQPQTAAQSSLHGNKPERSALRPMQTTRGSPDIEASSEPVVARSQANPSLSHKVEEHKKSSARGEDRIAKIAAEFLSWCRSTPSPDQIIDHGDWRIVPFPVLEAAAKKRKVGIGNFRPAFESLAGVQRTDNDYMITTQEPNGG
ncbi:TraI domain-containing protein (plasmid) [Azospirillum oryzae]|uniref:TraI domain-containing protein n=1 Tax=Azospirillum oryzae TaxID=286727 RepID=A0A6N1B5V2_9PROT|nr:MobH family relaxase [Azospirillum oryzae]KAA0584792.1 hypothetical protein FZ938_28810 [Azospirillum oryzae]QKS54632.1 TraI domain-containing protein [Azospirillum oryzae]GLR77514.1 hypothetical protein GCM10007856_01820 [Azospirillum oryzae]